ncbi:uncharacterized protein EAF02_005056 [Botrytis sinoallii]|uniref:uncharacterized protein n=1 Tax=Botrytis sinoallii TaxID=1463999 RepID=UPI0018FF8BE5|nr:uncharacterized protein EAF02_005056 [Botrytis sinoallii]KAF7884720.1 hypothetical protein EAF02_005056 [Botrytis sinoallii]
MNAQQELETAGIIGATIAPGNPVTVIHQQHVSPALVNRIKNLELSNKALKNRVLGHENTIASLDHNLKVQAWRVHALELNQQNQNAVIQSYDMARKSYDMQIATLKSYESCYDTQFKTQHILRSTQDEKIQLLEDRLKMHEDGFMNKTSTCIQSIGLDLKSQKLKIENHERKLDEKLACYEFVLMENQKRELSEKFASYEAVLLQKVKKSILANLIGSETQPSDDIGVKNEPRTKGS